MTLHEAVEQLGVAAISEPAVAEARARIERQLGASLPESVAALLRYPGLMTAVADTFDSDPVFPDTVRLTPPEVMPGASEPVLWLMTENQGVCAWGVPLHVGEEPPVLVGGDLEAGKGTVEYASTVAAFVSAFAWERRLLAREPVIQAQAAPLDEPTLAFLRRTYRERPSTAGWPSPVNLRFEGDRRLMLALWSGGSQCDWWISAGDAGSLEPAVSELTQHSNLRESLWSNEVAGKELLDRVRHRV